MCGIFFVFDQNATGAELGARYLDMAADYLKYRGPDGASSATGDHWVALHTLLSITGATKQPVVWQHGIALYNGEIYNDWQSYSPEYGDADLLRSALDADGAEAIMNLDGEYALIVLDESSQTLWLSSDTFRTKPIYYAIEGERIGCASYDYILKDAGFTAPVPLDANTVLQIDLRTMSIQKQHTLHVFRFDAAYVEEYDQFGEAFHEAVAKRAANIQRGLYVPLSSGHDSGLIAAELEAANIPFQAYGFEFAEVTDVIAARFKRLSENEIPGRFLAPSPSERADIKRQLIDGIPAFHLVVDDLGSNLYDHTDIRNVSGYVAAAYMARTARENGQLIALSGQGADEIISDYFNPFSNSRRSYFRGQWEKATKPWPNFFGGWNRVFLEATERIVGHYGIETRYPFLDRAVVQAFLDLSPEAKGRRYKGCISHRMDALNYPYHDRKIGFTGFAA